MALSLVPIVLLQLLVLSVLGGIMLAIIRNSRLLLALSGKQGWVHIVAIAIEMSAAIGLVTLIVKNHSFDLFGSLEAAFHCSQQPCELSAGGDGTLFPNALVLLILVVGFSAVIDRAIANRFGTRAHREKVAKDRFSKIRKEDDGS
jgi:hypothetical protein